MALKAITFDFIGTLLDGHSRNDLFLALGEVAKEKEDLRPILLEAAKAYGPMRREDIQNLKQSTLADLIAQVAKDMGKDLSPEDLLSLHDNVFDRATIDAKLFDDVETTLTALKKQGLTLGMLSNVSFPGDFYTKLLESLGIAHYFDAVLWSSDVGIRKPSPKIFAQVLEELGVSPNEAIHVGDIPNRDVRGAHAAGMRAVWMNRTGAARRHDEEEADWVVKTLGAILPIIDQER